MSACNICHLRNCDYKVPENYKPLYGMPDSNPQNPHGKLGGEKAASIVKNCLTLAHKTDFYVGADGNLHGYSWFNLLGRITLWIANYNSGGKIAEDAVKKIEETFEFILGIRKPLSKLCPTFVTEGENNIDLFSFIFSLGIHKYTSLAEKIIKKYPRTYSENLHFLAQRILHERPMWIKKTVDGIEGEYINCEEQAKDTPYEKTSVWSSEDTRNDP